MTPSYDIKTAFRSYRNIVFTVQNDLSFSNSMLTAAFSKLNQDGHNQLQSSIYTVYDIASDSMHGELKSFWESNEIRVEDLEAYRARFLSWVLNLTMLKIYNAVEIFLLQAIWLNKFPSLKNPTVDKPANDALLREIKNELLAQVLDTDTKNNRNIILYMVSQSIAFTAFLEQPIRIDLATTWGAFFELFSILRNVIAHQGTIVSQNLKNEIGSKAGDIFNRHFNLFKDLNGNLNLQPNIEQFSNLVNLINDFALNSVKFLSNESSLDFLEMN